MNNVMKFFFFKKSIICAILLSITCILHYSHIQGMEEETLPINDYPAETSDTFIQKHPFQYGASVVAAITSTAFFTYKAIKDNPKYFVPAALSAITAIGLLPRDFVYEKSDKEPHMSDQLKNNELKTMIPSEYQESIDVNGTQQEKDVLQAYKKEISNLLRKPIEKHNKTINTYNEKHINYFYGKSTLFYLLLSKLNLVRYPGVLAPVSPATDKDTLATLAWKSRCFIGNQIKKNKPYYQFQEKQTFNNIKSAFINNEKLFNRINGNFFNLYKKADTVYNEASQKGLEISNNNCMYDAVTYAVKAAQELGFSTIAYQELEDSCEEEEEVENANNDDQYFSDGPCKDKRSGKHLFKSPEKAIEYFKNMRLITIDTENNVIVCDYIIKHPGFFNLRNTIIYYINKHKTLKTQLTNNENFKIAWVSQKNIKTAVRQAQDGINNYICTMLNTLANNNLITIKKFNNLIIKQKNEAWKIYETRNAFDHIITTFAKEYTIRIESSSSKHSSSATYNPMFAFSDLNKLLESLPNVNDAEQDDDNDSEEY